MAVDGGTGGLPCVPDRLVGSLGHEQQVVAYRLLAASVRNALMGPAMKTGLAHYCLLKAQTP